MDGILPLWKERGMTSHDCVFKLRKILQMKKIGHGGTLDPDVDGVLPICLGKGTKIIEYLSDSGKVYCGEITLGTATETEDASGKVVARKDVRAPLSDEQIDLAMTHFLGEIKQIPPMYSAVKVAGKRLYEYARAGETVERPERSADIANYRRTSESVWNQELGTQTWKFEVACSKGTYVRTLAVDTGKYLGYPAHMSDLTRLSAASISATQCLTLEEVQNKMEAGTLETCIIPIEKAIPFFQQIVVHTNIYQKVKNGMSLAVESLHLDTMKPLSDEPIAIFYKGKLVSLYKKHPEKNSVLKPIKVLRNDL